MIRTVCHVPRIHEGDMTTIDVVRAMKLPRSRKELFLSRLLGELTLRARGAYEEGTDSADGARLRTFNELSHRVAGQLISHLTHSRDRYPDRVFLQILIDIARHGRCSDDLRLAFEHASRAMRSRRPTAARPHGG